MVGVVLGVVVVLGAIGVGVVGGVVVVGALTSRTHLQSSSARVKRGATHRIVLKVQMADFTTVCRGMQRPAGLITAVHSQVCPAVQSASVVHAFEG